MAESLEQEIRALRALFWSERDPDGRAFASLADAYLRMGELEEARTLLEDGLARHPAFLPGLVVAARLDHASGGLDAARAHLDRAVDLDPENVLVLGERSLLRREMGDEEGAKADVALARELEPGFEAPARTGPEEDEEEDPFGSEWDAPEGAWETPAPELAPEEEEDDDFTDLSGLSWEALRPDFDVAADALPSDDVEPAALAPGFEDIPAVPAAPADEDAPVDEEALADEETLADEVALADAVALADEVAPEEEEDAVFTFESAFDAAFGIDDGVADEEEAAPIHTRTLAELYARQGLTKEAAEVYRSLLEADPGNEELLARLAELTPPPEEPREVVEPEQPQDLEPLVQPHSPEPSQAAAGRPVREYFVDLFSWVPGAVPIESLAPSESTQALSEAPTTTAAPPEAETETGTGTGNESEAGAPPEDDGDLDDFQSWLKSLNQ